MPEKATVTVEIAEKPIPRQTRDRQVGGPIHHFHDHHKHTPYFVPIIPLTYKTVFLILLPRKRKFLSNQTKKEVLIKQTNADIGYFFFFLKPMAFA